MKKLLALFVLLFSLSTVKADIDKPIQVSQLPAKAQTFIQTYFPKLDVALSKVESDILEKKYKVIFTNGVKLEFSRKGEWIEVDCAKQRVPVAIIPIQIRQYTEKNYSTLFITEIERERSEYKVKLSNGVELEFDKQFRLLDID